MWLAQAVPSSSQWLAGGCRAEISTSPARAGLGAAAAGQGRQLLPRHEAGRTGWPKPRAGWLWGGRRSGSLARAVHHSRAESEGVVMGEQLLLEGKAAFFGISVTGSSLCWEGRLEVHARAWAAAPSLLTEAPISAVPALPAVIFSPSRYQRTKLDPGLEVSQGKAALQEPVSALHPSAGAGLPQEPRGIPARPPAPGDTSLSAHLPPHPRGHSSGGTSPELVTARGVTPAAAGHTAQLSAAGNSCGAEDSHGFGCRANPEPIHPPLPSLNCVFDKDIQAARSESSLRSKLKSAARVGKKIHARSRRKPELHVLGEDRAGECSGAEPGTATREGPPGVTRSRQPVPGAASPCQGGSGGSGLPGERDRSRFVCPRISPGSFTRARSRFFYQGSVPVHLPVLGPDLSARGSVLVLLPGLSPGSLTRGSVPVCAPRARSQFIYRGLGPGSSARGSVLVHSPRARSRCFHQGSLSVPPGSSCRVCPVECPAPFPNLSPKVFP